MILSDDGRSCVSPCCCFLLFYSHLYYYYYYESLTRAAALTVFQKLLETADLTAFDDDVLF
jgi:hypothetical protein